MRHLKYHVALICWQSVIIADKNSLHRPNRGKTNFINRPQSRESGLIECKKVTELLLFSKKKNVFPNVQKGKMRHRNGAFGADCDRFDRPRAENEEYQSGKSLNIFFLLVCDSETYDQVFHFT